MGTVEKDCFYILHPHIFTEKRCFSVPVVYKMDVLAALKEKGYSTYRLRQEKILGESVIQQLRNREAVSWANVARLCDLLSCDVGDILEYKNETEDQ